MVPHDKQLYGTATVGTKGQIVIPADAREALCIEPGDKLYIAGSASRKVLFALKEEQLQELVTKLTGELENVTELIKNANNDR